MTFVFASNNAHKLSEVRFILSPEVEVLSLCDIGFCSEIDETGETLQANSYLKAATVWQWLQEHPLTRSVEGVFADDTGLEIDALGGMPGVRTARWAGEPANDMLNRHKALRELEGCVDRGAQFRTVITLITSEREFQVEGVVRGTIAEQEKGTNGFGYDPLFIPQGWNEPFACLRAEVKNAISHRARALQAFKEALSL